MQVPGTTEVVGLFENRQAAERAVDALYSQGYDADTVGYLDRQRGEDGTVITDHDSTGDSTGDSSADDTGTAGEEAAKGAAGGAIGGAVVGAGAGLLASAGMLLIPGIGPFLAAGTVATTLGAAAAGGAGGAALGGAAGAIFGATTDDETSSHYRTGVDQGNALVTVDVSDGRQDEAVDLLRTAGAKKVDVHGDTGWTATPTL